MDRDLPEDRKNWYYLEASNRKITEWNAKVTIPSRNQASAKPTGLVSNAEKVVVIDKARASITELVEHNLRKHRQSEQG